MHERQYFSVPRQIGILGGTFQPIHLGHMDMALSALSVLNLDEVLLMPDRIPPHKDLPEGATDAQRLEMIRLSAQKYNGLTVSDMELMRPGKAIRPIRWHCLQTGCPTPSYISLWAAICFVLFPAGTSRNRYAHWPDWYASVVREILAVKKTRQKACADVWCQSHAASACP